MKEREHDLDPAMLDTVVAQLRQWVSLKTRVTVEFSAGIMCMTLAGYLHPCDVDNHDAFFFVTLSHEILIPVVPSLYDCVSLKEKLGTVLLTLEGSGGALAVRRLTAQSDLLLSAVSPLSRLQ